MSTISSLVNHGIVLGSGYSSPLIITSTGTVYVNPTGTAVAVDASAAASVIINSGTIKTTRGQGVVLHDSSTLTNSGYIYGTTQGVFTNGGYVSNSSTGVIKSGYAGIRSANAETTIVNSGAIEGGIQASTGVTGIYLGAGGTVTNSGAISGRLGVDFRNGGTLINSEGGRIEGTALGFRLNGAPGAVVNSGTIVGTAVSGVTAINLYQNATFTNTSTGVIEGASNAIRSQVPTALTIMNSGTLISSTGPAVNFVSYGGNVTNQSGGLITGITTPTIGSSTVVNYGVISRTSGFGVQLQGTVINAGTISGNTAAVGFIGTGNLLILEHGYKLVGGVAGSAQAGATNQVILSGSAGAAVTVDYNALGLTNIGTIGLADGAGDYATLRITDIAVLPKLIVGLDGLHEAIDLTTIGTNALITNIDVSNHTITVTGSGGAATLQFDATADLAGLRTHSDGVTGSSLAAACFARGTLILTENGEVPIEELAAGDRVVTLSGEAQPIKWIGHRAYDGRFIADNRQVLPIRIAPGSFAEGVPSRDLLVSPEHAVYLDGCLIPARYLVNGATVVQVDSIEQVEYFHLEFDTHDVIFADGAPAESFVDCNNRMMFANGAEFARLYPDDARSSWEFCAPRLEADDPAMIEIRSALLWRAEFLGHDMTIDPDLHLIVDGAPVYPGTSDGLVYRFRLPAGAASVQFASRTAVPAELDPLSRDTRRLGVPIEHIQLSDSDLTIEACHTHAALVDGFHSDEPAHRWTSGIARLPQAWLQSFRGTVIVEVRLAARGFRYRQGANAGPLAVAA